MELKRPVIRSRGRHLVAALVVSMLTACGGASTGESNDATVDDATVDDAGADIGALVDADVTAGPTMNWSVVAENYSPGALFSGWAGGADDLWFVGGEMNAPLVLRYDGSAWSHTDPGTGEQMWWVHGFDGGPVFVVGDRGAIARYEAGNWEQMPTGLPGVTLYGVWGATPDDVWAVGGPYALADAGHPTQGPTDDSDRRTDILLHYDGFSWTQALLPVLPERSAAAQSFFKVWGTSADDVYVVGGARLILRYDGTEWTVEDAGEGSQQIFTVTGRGPGDIWAIGGGASAVLLHRDDTGWSEVELPPYTPQVVQGIWTAPGEPVYISGFGGFVARLDDAGWTVADPFTPQGLHAIVGDPDGGIWAAGGNIMAAVPNYRGTLGVANRDVPALEWEPTPEPDVIEDTTGDTTNDVADATDGGSEPDSDDVADVGPDVEPGPVACDAPMTSCPEDPFVLFPGGPCDDDLFCDYDVYGTGDYFWYYTCVDGRWTFAAECLAIGGSCGIPPPAEACLDPYAGQMTGASFDIGPSSLAAPFTPFVDGEMLDLVWGGQGSPMVEFRLKLDGIDDMECISYQMTVETSAGTNAVTAGTVRLRCGESLGMYIVLPMEFIDCDESLFDLHIEIMVEGFGTRTYDVQFQGGGSFWC